MEKTRLIKNVDDESWRSLKSEAAKHGKPLGKFLTVLIKEHEKREMEKSNWDAILSTKKLLTAKEAEEVEKAMAIFEKSYGFED